MSSVPSKPRPPKPPRIKKGPSVPNGHIDSDTSQESPPTLSSSVVVPSSPIVVPSSAPSSTVLPPPTPPYKPDGKPIRATSLEAAATITKALKKIKRVEDEKALKQQLEEPDNTSISRTSSSSSRDDPFIVVDQDLSTRSRRIDSLTQDNVSSQSSPSQSPRVPSSPKPIPFRPKRRGTTGDNDESLFEGSPVPSSVGSSSKLPLSPPKKDKKKEKKERKESLSSSGSIGKKPLLPPSLKVAPPRLPSLPRPLLPAHSLSTSEQSQEDHVTPKESATSDDNDANERSKFTFSSTETDESSLPSDSAQTTPTKLTSGGVVTDETMDRGGESASLEETDGLKLGNKKKPTPITTPPKPLLPSKPGTKLPKVKVKGDDSWIQRKTNQSEPPPISRGLSQSSDQVSPSPEKKGLKTSLSVPYRSHAIISPGTKRQSSTDALLRDKSKPMIGPSGEYYPPAVRSITPEPFKTSNDNEIKEEEEEEEMKDSLKGIRRFAKNRRSNSFSGNADKKVRPVSVMSPSVSNTQLVL